MGNWLLAPGVPVLKVTLAPTIYTNPVSIAFLGTIINDFDGNNNSISINYPGNTNQYKLVDLISG
jgi:hypothetical protein